ncbi:serine protease inhibitor 88Ea-like [Contarinia nasturtii]|uniref:serine protease inhibitor 88Ea-like n=1 Tax=Contarinia nasturtii TaxID=265458 RepID=UPI0012D4335A|nr:serine protease inhibitor 88Ea-like [Contarinia nasturtii]
MKKLIIFTIIALLAVVSIVAIIWILPHSIRDYRGPELGNLKYFHNIFSSQDSLGYKEKPDYSSEKRTYQPYFGQLNFSLKILDSLQKEHPNENVFYSPHSLYRTLLLAYLGAGGETEKELKDLLGLHWAESKADIEYMYKLEKEVRAKRFQSQSQNQTIELNSVNKFYVSVYINMRERAKQLFNDSIEQLNFADDPHQCIEHINQFVENVTKNNIKNFVYDQITNNTLFTIVNAIYFKGAWLKKFNKQQTDSKLFYVSSGEPLYVDMMYKREEAEYGFIRSLDVKFLKMPYKGENGSISMYIFLPLDNSTSIDELLGKFTDEILDYAFSGAETRVENVKIYFPKFTLEKTSDLESAMKRMGSQNLFKNSNFSDFFESEEIETKTKLIHKAKIDIYEEGTKAAAATGYAYMIASKRYKYEYEIFNCNHPFLYMIHDNKFKEILFAGIYNGPK